MLHELGATDLESVLDRATLQGKIDTARKLHAMLGRPRPTAELLGGPAPADRPLAEPPTLCPPGPRGTLGGAASRRTSNRQTVMRLEFLPDSPSGPILLLHGDAEDATVLFQAFEELALGVRDSIALHELPTIESPERCHVVASAVSGAEGLQSVSEQDIVWRLPRSGWQKVATLVAPFTSLPDASRAGSQRLYDDGTASVILSTMRSAPRERPDPRPGMQGRSRDKSKW